MSKGAGLAHISRETGGITIYAALLRRGRGRGVGRAKDCLWAICGNRPGGKQMENAILFYAF
jgi:hypothetical protein